MFLFLDFETFSKIPISSGVRKYVSCPDFDVICGVFAFVGRSLTIDSVLHYQHNSLFDFNQLNLMLENAKTIVAHNIEFDLEVYIQYLEKKKKFPSLSGKNFVCTRKRQSFLNQPASLKNACFFHGLEEKKQENGKDLIAKLSVPDKNGNRLFDAELERKMLKYCEQDVRTTINLFISQNVLMRDSSVRDLDTQMIDLKINRTGFPVNLELAKGILKAADEQAARIQLEACELLDDFEIPALTQTVKLKKYIKENFGCDVISFNAKEQSRDSFPEKVKKLLEYRDLCTQTSLQKCNTVLESAVNGRLYNQFFYCGTHTGRWAGRDFQPQNLPRGGSNDLKDFLRNIISCGDKTDLITIDYSSIEHRVLFHFLKKFMDSRMIVCKETQKHWESFAQNADPYINLAAKIYNIDAEKVSKEQRQVGKVAHLGLGYGMGAAKFKSYSAGFGLLFSDEEAKNIVDVYRSTYSILPELWALFNNLFLSLTTADEDRTVYIFYDMIVNYKKSRKITNNLNSLTLRMPSGRCLYYYDLAIEHQNNFKILKIGSSFVHGGLLVENLIQGVCRDLLAYHMRELDTKIENARIVGHVHDEIIIESKKECAEKNLQTISTVATTPPTFLTTLHLHVTTISAKFYAK